MSGFHTTEQHLRVIRTLMERAPIYRAISTSMALVGGGLSTFVTGASLWWHMHRQSEDAPHFLRWWLLTFLITSLVTTLFIWRAAARRGEPLISPSFKLAISTLFPPCLSGGIVSLAIGLTSGNSYGVAIVWTIFYGLALLTTAHFAPRSLLILGWSFLLTGLVAFLLPFFEVLGSDQLLWPEQLGASWLMGTTFGFFHLVYAACVWSRRNA